MLKRFLVFISCVFMIGCYKEDSKAKIYLTQIVEHPALNETRRGIIDGLKEAGYSVTKYKSAQGNIMLANQIAKQYIADSPDVIVAISTPSAQTFLKASVPVVFSSITDPEGAGLTERPCITGISNFLPFEPQLRYYKSILPKMKKLGIIYNPSDANSIAMNMRLKEVSKSFDIEIIEKAVNQLSELSIVTNQITQKVDALFVLNDNLVLSGFSTVVKIATRNKVPVFVRDTDTVNQGALASYGPNQYEVGKQTAKMVVQILNSKAQRLPPIATVNKGSKVFNQEQAQKLNIPFNSQQLIQVSS